MNKQLEQLQRELALALQDEQAEEQTAKDWQADYEAKLAEFEAQHKDLIESRDTAKERHTEAKNRVKELRDKAKDLLGDTFLEDDLPDGFVQKKSKEVTYDEQGLFKIAVDRFPFLLKLDEKAVHKFFTDWATEDKGSSELVLPEHIRCWASVHVSYVPLVNISNAKLLKLKFDADNDSPQDESAQEQAKKHLEQFAEENNIDPAQPTDGFVIPPQKLEDIKF